MGEIRTVDDDKRIRARRRDRACGLTNASQNHEKPSRDRRKPKDREIVDGKKTCEPRRSHRVTAHAGETNPSFASLRERPHQRPTEPIA